MIWHQTEAQQLDFGMVVWLFPTIPIGLRFFTQVSLKEAQENDKIRIVREYQLFSYTPVIDMVIAVWRIFFNYIPRWHDNTL